MPYLYKNDYREGVIFCFYKDGKINIEHRPLGNGKEDVFFTNGTIEVKDREVDGDYRLVALKREIDEEFDGKIKIKKFEYLGEAKAEAINILFYVYLITSWEGEMPDYTVEEGKKFSRVEWADLGKAEAIFEYESAEEICGLIKDFIKKSVG
jgi:hypothetical protein